MDFIISVIEVISVKPAEVVLPVGAVPDLAGAIDAAGLPLAGVSELGVATLSFDGKTELE
jgi:hypothetical protein